MNDRFCRAKKILSGLALLLVPACLFPAPALEADTAGQQARRILESSGVKGGLIVHAGCGDGRLTAALHAGDSFLVHGLARSNRMVKKARAHIRSQEMDGMVSVDRWDGGRLPHADSIVKLLVVDGSVKLPERECMRVLTPGGVVHAAGKNGVKPWPDEIDEWTHWLHGPGSNPVAADTRVGVPRRMRWTASPRRARSHEKGPSLTGMVTARGRLFYINDEAPVSIGGRVPDRWRLVARDAFSGVLLWKKPVPDWGWRAWSPAQPMNLRWGNPRFIHRRLVAVGNHVYVTLGYSAPVSVLDARTGDVIRTLPGTGNTSEILCHNGILILSVRVDPGKGSTRSAPRLSILAVDPETGKTRWRTDPVASLADLSERGKKDVIKQGRLMTAAAGNRVVAAIPREIIGYDLATGETAWRVNRPPLPGRDTLPEVGSHHLGMLIINRGRVYFGQPHKLGKMSDKIPMTLVCLDAASGKKLWERQAASWTYTTSFNAYAIGDTLVVFDKGMKYRILDAATGKTVRVHDAACVRSPHHHCCYRNKATEKFVIMGKEGVEYLDIRTGEITVNRWVRGTCLYGIMPANGLLYTTPEACACNQMNRIEGFTALAVAGKPAEANHPLIKGPAWGAAGDALPAGAWPQYRRGPLRSGFTGIDPEHTDRTRNNQDHASDHNAGWTVTLDGTLTSPVSDGSRIFVGCGSDVVALSCSSGEVIWRAPERIDSPPSLYRGLVLYGTRSGWVYCRRADDGELSWRFRAAPEERFIVDDNHIESAWPLHGSLMIFRDRLYATAGRSSNLDGGLRLFALDPVTGKILAQKTFFTEQTRQSDFYEGVTSDLLAGDGGSLFLKHMKIDPESLAIRRLYWWNFTGPDGMLKPRYDKSRVNLPVESKRTPYLCAPAGLLDDELFGRSHVQLDGAEFCNRLAFNRKFACGVRHSMGPGHFQFHRIGNGFDVLCFDRLSRKKPPERRSHWSQGSLPADHRLVWKKKIPVRPCAIMIAGDRLLVGGGPERVFPGDPLRSPEWRAGGLIHTLNLADGTTVKTERLPAPPVHEGIIAIPAGIFACLRNGQVMKK